MAGSADGGAFVTVVIIWQKFPKMGFLDFFFCESFWVTIENITSVYLLFSFGFCSYIYLEKEKKMINIYFGDQNNFVDIEISKYFTSVENILILFCQM